MANEFNYITCPKCGHDRNPSTAKKCEICGQALGKKSSPLPLLLGCGFGLLTLAGLGFFGYRALTGGSTPTTGSPTAPTSTANSKTPVAPTGSPPPLNQGQLITGANPDLYATFAQIPNVPAGTFNYGGATTFAPLRSTKVVDAIAQSHPEFRLRYADPVGKKPGSGTGIEMVTTGELSFAQSSRPLKDEEISRAKQRGVSLEQVPVAIDGLAFYVNPQLQIPGLTVTQLKDIFTGKIINWQEVGGPNLPITAISRDPQAGGTVEFFIDSVLQRQPLGSSVKIVRDTTTGLRLAGSTPGGIGYATAPEVIGQRTIRSLPIAKSAGAGFISPATDSSNTQVNEDAIQSGAYPITRRLFVIIRRDGRLDEQAGVAYTNLLLSKEGQDLIRAAGFAPVR